MIIDVHTHIFRRVHGQIASGPTRSMGQGLIQMGDHQHRLMPPGDLETTHPVEALIAKMDAAGVDMAMLLQGSLYGECNELVLQALDAYPDRLWAAAFLDIFAADAQAAFEREFQGKGFRALKLELSMETGLIGLHPGYSLADKGLEWLWSALEAFGQVLVLDLGGVGSESYQTAAVRQIAETHPALNIVIAHLAQPNWQVLHDPALCSEWAAQIELGLLPNVWFDMAALPLYLPTESYPFASASEFLQRAVDVIGTDRLMWGSDIPGLLTRADYPHLLSSAEQQLAFLSEAERQQVMGGNAWRLYGDTK
ncbi:MAG: amidohydrolase family protein [Armatimonadota bacterium]